MRRIARVAIHFNRRIFAIQCLSSGRYYTSEQRPVSGCKRVTRGGWTKVERGGTALIQKGLNKFAIGRSGNALGKWDLHIWITMLDDSNWYRCLFQLVRISLTTYIFAWGTCETFRRNVNTCVRTALLLLIAVMRLICMWKKYFDILQEEILNSRSF